MAGTESNISQSNGDIINIVHFEYDTHSEGYN